MRRQTLKSLFWIVLGAGLTALPLILPQIGFLSWFGMIPLVHGAVSICKRADCTRRAAFGSGFLAGFVFYFVLFHWLVYLSLESVGMSAGASAAVVAAGWIGVPTLYGLLSGAVFLIFRAMHKTGIFEIIPLLRPFAFAALWTGYEWLTAQTWMGVPWGRLALGQVDMRPVLWIASVFGSYAVAFLIVSVNALLVEIAYTPKKTVLCGILAAALFVGNLGCGLIWINREIPAEKTIKAAALQGNIGVDEKWSGGDDLSIYMDLTRQAAADGAELIVWPETALPFAPIKLTWDTLEGLARETNADLIVGALYYDEEWNQYNALYFVDREKGVSDTIYLKRHLVPFGEYVPLRSVFETLVPPLAELAVLEDLSAGSASALFESEWGKIGSLICFDSIYDALAGASARDGAELLVISSNDSWFYDSAAVYQHNAQAQLRAVETGKWVVRAANTGISSVVTPQGSITEELAPLTKGYLLQTVETVSTKTVYSRIGNVFVYLCLAFSAGVLVAGWITKRRKFTEK